MVEVYRALKASDITDDLVNKEVHILWPDDGVWYSAVVKELKVDQLWAKVEYTLTYETEEMELQELLDSGDIAVVEKRPKGHVLVEGETAVDKVKRDADLLAAEDEEEEDDAEVGKDDDKDSDYEDSAEDNEDGDEHDDDASDSDYM